MPTQDYEISPWQRHVTEGPLRLRWRFDYAGKPMKAGIWDGAGQNDKDVPAWQQSREGLLYAAIEAECQATGVSKILAACRGQDYALHQWASMARASIAGLVQPKCDLIGMRLITRAYVINVFKTGEVRVDERSPEDLEFNYQAFGPEGSI